MYVAFFFYSILFDLLLVSYSNLIADCLLVFSECFLLLFFRLVLVLVWYWHWWQELWNIYGITNVNIIKILFKAKSFVCHHVKILVYSLLLIEAFLFICMRLLFATFLLWRTQPHCTPSGFAVTHISGNCKLLKSQVCVNISCPTVSPWN